MHLYYPSVVFVQRSNHDISPVIGFIKHAKCVHSFIMGSIRTHLFSSSTEMARSCALPLRCRLATCLSHMVWIHWRRLPLSSSHDSICFVALLSGYVVTAGEVATSWFVMTLQSEAVLTTPVSISFSITATDNPSLSVR